MAALPLKLTRVNLWHFVWIAIVLSVLLSLLLSQLIHKQIVWEYPFGATLIAFTVSSLLIYFIKRMRDLEQTLAEHALHRAQEATERWQVEEALRESEARLQAIVENSPNTVFLKDTEGRYLLVNRQFEKMFHLTREAIVGKTDDEIFPPQQAAAFRANDRKVFEAGVALQFEEVALHDDGPHTSIVFKFPLCTVEGHPYAIGGITTDITERKRVDEELRASEGRFRAFMDNSPVAVFIKDKDGRYVYINRRIEHRFETTAAHWIGKTDLDLWPKEAAERLRANDLIVLSQGPSSVALEVVESVPDHTGSDSYWLSFKFPLFDSVGAGFVGAMAIDITELKRTEEALRESEQRLRRALEDRERLSQDLHDTVIQSIYAVGMALEGCQYLIEKDPVAAAQKLQSGIANLNAVIRQVRNYIEGASLNVTSSGQLREALEDLVRTIPSSCSLAIRLQIDSGALEQLTDEEATHVLQITREAISNSLRHSGSKTGVVSLCRKEGGLRLEVQDDGVGFDANTRDGHGLGLRNMAARASKLGAQFSVSSDRGRGTRIILDIPKEHDHAPVPSDINPAAAC
ncbi:MAG: PAS domain-containing sensor histidine kinase [Nitrospiraceae bacterium]